MPDIAVVILGCGYTGKRVAQRFLARGASVLATTRDAASLADLSGADIMAFEAEGLGPIAIPANALVLHSIPVIETAAGTREFTSRILARLAPAPRRVVYLSTTGVYGATRDVDEHTPPAPHTEREKLRLAAEDTVRAGAWSSLVLRPAAIYGPERGIHVSMREGRFQLVGAGDNFVSRIHVDDLAAHAEAALLSEFEGAWPVGDDLPCASREIAEYCAQLMHLPAARSVSRDGVHETRRADRRVNGRAIREALGIGLAYPTYREGLAQALSAQSADAPLVK